MPNSRGSYKNSFGKDIYTSNLKHNMNNLNNTYQKDSNIVYRKIADEYILVPIRQQVADLNCIYTLNEIGAFIWELIDGKSNIKQILKNITAAYDVEEKAAKDDLISFISQLLKIKAIDVANGQ